MSECVVPTANIKTFAKFLTTLAKFGDDIYLDYREDKLLLSTFNTAKSVYAVISIQPSFFDSYAFVPGQRCHRLLIKPLGNIFKNSSQTDTIEQCRIKSVSELGEERLVVQLACRFGVLKTHRFNYEACESMQPVYSKDCLHKWIASPRMIHDLLAHFQQKLKEVTLSCGISWFKIKSFEDSFVPDGSTVVRSLETEITVDVTEFELYQVFGEANLTFELKDFKTALAFAELVELPITAHFDQNEGPISFSCVPYPNHFTANFVVAATFNAQGTQTLDPTRSQAAAMQPNQAAIPSLQSGQIQSTGNDSQTPQRQFPKYQLQLQQHQESEQEYEMDASGTIVQPSQNVFKPLPGLHHDYVEVLVPQSPTGTNEQESDLGEEYHSQHEQFYDTTPRSGESKENRLESRLINLMANQDDEFICITTGDKGREYGERKTKKMKK